MRLVIILTAIVTLAVAAFALLSPVVAQRSVCADYDKIAARLVHKYGEAPFWQGLGPNGKSTFELWTTLDRTTWTIIEVKTNGKACVRSAGEQWFALPWPPRSGV